MVDSCGGAADLTELDLPLTMKTNFPDPADLLNFTLTITPDEGMYSYSVLFLIVNLTGNPSHFDLSLQACTRVARLSSPL
jgi:hypothetical protein